MPKEHYEPTPEDIVKAERSMSEEQSQASRDRHEEITGKFNRDVAELHHAEDLIEAFGLSEELANFLRQKPYLLGPNYYGRGELRNLQFNLGGMNKQEIEEVSPKIVELIRELPDNVIHCYDARSGIATQEIIQAVAEKAEEDFAVFCDEYDKKMYAEVIELIKAAEQAVGKEKFGYYGIRGIEVVRL